MHAGASLSGCELPEAGVVLNILCLDCREPDYPLRWDEIEEMSLQMTEVGGSSGIIDIDMSGLEIQIARTW